jgi:diadenosine tetraphosphate (Ap4A) HIT family hydrolase
MNATMRKFGFPGTLLREYAHWAVLLRPQQVTLASLVIAAKSDAEAFSALPAAAFGELSAVISDVERGLKSFAAYDKINYLMLMMVDPHVHMHVIPRYKAPKDYGGISFTDAGWPGPPDLKSINAVPEDVLAAIDGSLRQALAGS